MAPPAIPPTSARPAAQPPQAPAKEPPAKAKPAEPTGVIVAIPGPVPGDTTDTRVWNIGGEPGGALTPHFSIGLLDGKGVSGQTVWVEPLTLTGFKSGLTRLDFMWRVGAIRFDKESKEVGIGPDGNGGVVLATHDDKRKGVLGMVGVALGKPFQLGPLYITPIAGVGAGMGAQVMRRDSSVGSLGAEPEAGGTTGKSMMFALEGDVRLRVEIGPLSVTGGLFGLTSIGAGESELHEGKTIAEDGVATWGKDGQPRAFQLSGSTIEVGFRWP